MLMFNLFTFPVNSNLRQFQHFEDRDLPSNLKSMGIQSSVANASPLRCAEECVKQQSWCRSFTYSPSAKKCDLYTGSILTASDGKEIDPIEVSNIDLYLLSKYETLFMKTFYVLSFFLDGGGRRGGRVLTLHRFRKAPEKHILLFISGSF